jgi:hypothetical protein
LVSEKANEFSPLTRVKTNDIGGIRERKGLAEAGDEKTSKVRDRRTG